jgi:hypothetical protein
MSAAAPFQPRCGPAAAGRDRPAWDHEISVSQLSRAPPAEVFDAATNLDLFRLPAARVLLEARALPSRLASAAARRHGRPAVERNRRLAARCPR